MTLEADGNVDSKLEGSRGFTEGAYNLSGYIVSSDQVKLRVELPVGAEISVVREDRPGRGLDDLAELEEDIANLRFFEKQGSGAVNVNWFNLDGSAKNTRWLSDQPDVVKESQPEQGLSGTRTSAVARMDENQEESPESTGAKNFARDSGSLSTVNTEQEAALKRLEQEKIKDLERAKKAKASTGTKCAIDGNLTAPSHPSKWKCDRSNCQWIGFTEINGLYIYGSGTINAQGTKWWGSSNVNHTRKYHGSKPTGFVIAHSNHVHISDLTFINSPQMHMALERSTWVYVYNLTITAPGDSPNTDGIHIQHSTHVFISQTHIGTGDDCISIGDGSLYLNISMITCGPGHGISIGSLGIKGPYETVENVYVSNVEFRGTSNGARIKTWQKSAVQISNIRYSYIYGTSKEDTTIHFACSEIVPCKDIIW
ncbi:probable polygalacturonase At3g15720 [Camellia sinensis]|uniref:probable polygalacturonase At3g15720 n=1 Tax=Camellia sinensis TaxID=4442 RepID=UPI001036AEAD|nr:probable polygalacturonase At3g15720 [Camellia sinensis]